MSTWTLADIRQKVRAVTGRYSPYELTNDEINTYINDYYVYTLPAEVKLEHKLVYYTFLTSAYEAYYDAPDATYTNVLPNATADNLSMEWYQDPNIFNNQVQTAQQYTLSQPWTGDASTVTFSTTTTGTPILPGTMTIDDTVESFRDTSETWSTADQTLTGSEGGTATINYLSGSVSVTFNTAPTSGQAINLNYVAFAPGRPQNILYFQNRFQLYPVPDQAYVIRMQAYQSPTALSADASTPDLSEWGPMIAYGAARNIHADNAEMEAYQRVTTLYQEQVQYVLTRTCQSLLNTRAQPQF